MNYQVKIDDGILKAKISGHHSIWMHRAPRGKGAEAKPGIYILADERGYCCYVGETDSFKVRMASHESKDKFCWWTHSIYFWDENPTTAFGSTDDRRWYEKSLKEAVETEHPTFTKSVQNKPEPESGGDVLAEMLNLLDVIGFEVRRGTSSSPTTDESEEETPPIKPPPTEFKYDVGKVVQAVFPVLQSDPRMTKGFLKDLCNRNSSKVFKTGGKTVLIPRTGNIDEIKDSKGRVRYYSKLPLTFFGKEFWLTSQFQPLAIGPVLDRFVSLGFTLAEIERICDKRWAK